VGAREYDPRTARWLQRDPIDAASGDPNLYRYCGNDPINAKDPSGQDWLDDLANFFAGWGDTLTFGLTAAIRQWMGVDSVVNRCSGQYHVGQIVGVIHATAIGGAAGYARNLARASLPPRFNRLFWRHTEYVDASHWIPRRSLVRMAQRIPRLNGAWFLKGNWNTKHMYATDHALIDPYRWRFMTKDFKVYHNPHNPKVSPLPVWLQQWKRIPDQYQWGAAGLAYGASSSQCR